MKVEITERGANGLAVGAIVEIEGETVPGWLIGKCRIVEDAPRVAVTNPAEGAVIDPDPSAQERQTLLGEAAKIIAADAFTEDGRPDVRAINAELADEVKPFTAAERDALWPGIADAVKAARA